MAERVAILENVCRIMCRRAGEVNMPTNLHIDSGLLEQAQRLGHHRTKRETVNEALREYIQYRKRVQAVEAFGTIEFDPDYDYKKMRNAR